MADTEFKTKENKIQTLSVKLLLMLTVMEKYPFFLDLCINFLSGRHFLELNSCCFREVFTCYIVLLKNDNLSRLFSSCPHLFGILI